MQIIATAALKFNKNQLLWRIVRGWVLCLNSLLSGALLFQSRQGCVSQSKRVLNFDSELHSSVVLCLHKQCSAITKNISLNWIFMKGKLLFKHFLKYFWSPCNLLCYIGLWCTICFVMYYLLCYTSVLCLIRSFVIYFTSEINLWCTSLDLSFASQDLLVVDLSRSDCELLH